MSANYKQTLFLILAGIFITNTIVAELIGGKLIFVGDYLMSIGILPWPIVFLTTDLINEYYGQKQVRKLSFITAGLITYCFLILALALNIPAAELPGLINVSNTQFHAVFGQSLWIIVGSIIAFICSQLIDISLFHWLKSKTGKRMIWLRTTGSTIISQFFDSFIVLGIAFYLPGKLNFEQFISSGFTGYFVKLIIAVALTPVIYIAHYWIDSYLQKSTED